MLFMHLASSGRTGGFLLLFPCWKKRTMMAPILSNVNHPVA